MPAGLNLKSRIWRIDWDDDDVVGGAMVTGSCVYTDVYTRMEPIPPSQLLLQQGLETEKTFRALVAPSSLIIYERDELEVTSPANHEYYGNRFRILAVSKTSVHPTNRRGYINLTLSRSVRAHGSQ